MASGRISVGLPRYDGKYKKDAMRSRIEQDAEVILEQVMCRRNWGAPLRDKLADCIEGSVMREVERMGTS